MIRYFYICPHCEWIRDERLLVLLCYPEDMYCPRCNEVPISDFNYMPCIHFRSDPDPEDMAGEGWKKA